MRRMLVCVALLVLVFVPSVVRADFPLKSNVDFASATYATGWALNCPTGVMPNHIEILDYNATTTVATWLRVSLYMNGDRPDVQAAFGGVCPGLTRYTGYTAIYDALPSGDHYVSVFWSDFADHSQSSTAYVHVN